MAATFRQLMEPVDPVQPTIRFGAVLARFSAEPDLDILPVVFGRTLIGCIYRQAAFELAGSDIPRAHLQDARIAPLLDETPATADTDQRIGGYAARSAAHDRKALYRGVVVLDGGAYAGVVRPRRLSVSLAEENAHRARANRKLSEAVKGLESRASDDAAEQARVRALIAHELRTPLNAAQVSADMLGQHTSSSDGKLLARTVAEACDALDRLLDDMMVVSQSELGELPVKPEPLSLKRLSADIEALWRPRCEHNGLGFELSLGKLAAERIEVDGTRLRQVLDNLLSNAIKYTDTGRVSLEIVTIQQGEDLMLVADVTDTGPGLSGEALQRIFKPFERTRDASAIDGTGLGLTVTKAVTERIGGTITYRTGEPSGSVFSLSIPVQKAGPRMVSENRRAGAMHRFEVGDILLVDDHEPSRVVLAKALTGAGFRVDAVHTLAQALRRAGHKPYQAILCDLHLPDGDGAEIVRSVRRGDSPNADTPLIAVTADRSKARLAACIDGGFDTVWTKPIRPNDAIIALADLIVSNEVRRADSNHRSAIA